MGTYLLLLLGALSERLITISVQGICALLYGQRLI